MLNIRKFIMRPAAVMLSAVMLVGSSFVSGNNIDSATEASGITYIKHYYNSDKPDEEYTLEPLEYSTGFSMPRWVDPIDHRPNANPVPSGIVKLGNVGTAFIVGEHEIMTAAHCVYTASIKDFSDDPNLMISLKQPFSDEISLTEIACHIPKDYTNVQTGIYDYAIITVKEDLTDYGIFNLGRSNEKIVDKTPIHTYGYSSIKTENPQNLKVSDGTIYKYEEYANIVSKDCYTTSGTSGGPVVTKCKINGTVYWEVIGIASSIRPYYDENSIKNYEAIYNKVDDETIQFLHGNTYLDEEEFIWQE